MAWVRVVRAFRLPITAIITALALSGCMRTTGPVAVAPQGDLRFNGLWPTNSPPPQAVAADSGGGAIGALRAAFAAATAQHQRPWSSPHPWPMSNPCRCDTTRPIISMPATDCASSVYGQEGLTNTYAIDAGGSITMPLIGSVGARPHHGGTGGGDIGEIARGLHQVRRSRWRSKRIGRSSFSEVAATRAIRMPNMTVESAVAIAGGFSPRARRDSVTVTHTDASGTARFVVPPGSPISPGDTVLVSERWF